MLTSAIRGLRPRHALPPLLLVLVAAGSALASANAVAPSGAGDGQGAISGYSVSNIRYALRTGVPQRLWRVTFTLSPVPPPASTVRIKTWSDPSAPWYTCTLSGANANCLLSPNTAAAFARNADALRVVVAD